MASRVRAQRHDLRAPVEYRGDGIQGQGTIWNISRSGALVERASPLPQDGMHLGLAVSYYPGSNEIELWGEVVRVTRGGFALEYTTLGASALALLERVLPH